MSDSLSSADRDARIAAIEADIREEQSRDIGDHCGVFHIPHVVWLIAELRAALSREEEAKKDAERAFLAGASFVAGEDSHGASVFEAAAKYAEEHGTAEEIAGLRRMLAEWKRDFVALAADRRL